MLVLGICGLVVCGICGIIAWVMGSQDIAEMKAGAMDPSGYSITNAGRTCGVIATLLNAVGLALIVLVFAFAAMR